MLDLKLFGAAVVNAPPYLTASVGHLNRQYPRNIFNIVILEV